MTARREGSPLLRCGRAKVTEVFVADLRSLAAFRIVLAVLVLADLANRATDLSAHYADKGVLPRPTLLREVMDRWQFSLNMMNGEPFFQALLFGVAALAALGLLVGYRTRLMTIIVWVAVLSIQWRNPLVVGNDAVLLRMLLFWSMFLPLGAYWSVDRALKAAPAWLSMRFLSLATVGLFMQIAFMYWFTAILKSGREWRVDGTALYYALSIDQIVTPIGAYLHQFPTLLEVLTFGTIGLEAVGPFLLFCPVLTGPVRTGAVLAFMSLHFGIWLTMDIGIFPWISAFCMVCFLPGWFWDKVVPKVSVAFPGRPTIARHLRRVTHPVHAHWLPIRARLSPAGGVVGRPHLGVGSAGYGDNRSGSPASSTPSEQGTAQQAMPERGTWHGGAGGSGSTMMLRSSLATNLLAAFFLLYVFCWNLMTVSAFTMPERLVPLAPLLGLGQSWVMFAPHPIKDDGWYVIPGTLRGGQQVDLMAVTRNDYHPREGVSWEKPRYVVDTYNNEHWQKYLENIRQEGYADLRRPFARYICRKWNARHTGDERLVTFQMVYMLETTQPDYRRTTPQKEVLWEHSCLRR